MAALTLISTLTGWYNLRFVSQVEQANTQALIPTMDMARQLSEASAWETVFRTKSDHRRQ